MKRAWASLLVIFLLGGYSSARPSKEADPLGKAQSPTATVSPSPWTATVPSQTTAEDIAALRAEIEELQRRLDQLEPPAPIRVDAPPIDLQVKAILAPGHVREVLETGRELPFGLMAVSQTWQPPEYSPSWHSTSYNRFATVQNIAEAARHRFVVQTVFQGSLATADQSLTGVGLADLQLQPCGKSPAYPCVGSPDESAGSWKVYALKAHVESVRQQGSLVVFNVQPQLEGLEIIWLDKAILGPALGDQQSVWAAFASSAGEVWDVGQVR